MNNTFSSSLAYIATLLFVVFATIACLTTGCKRICEKQTKVEQFFDKVYDAEVIAEPSKNSSEFFIFNKGSYQRHDEMAVSFMWKCEDEYYVSTFPLSSVRVVFKNIETPQIKFSLNSHVSYTTINKIVKYNTDHVTITCNKKHWTLIRKEK